jgi:hypothetical protein
MLASKGERKLESGLHNTVADRWDPEIAQLAATLRDRSLLDR